MYKIYGFTSPDTPIFFILYSLSIINTCTPGKGAPTGENLLCSNSHAFETSIKYTKILYI